MTTINVRYAPAFLRRLKQLQKKYPHVSEDAASFANRLRNGETPGDHIQGVGYTVYKARIASSDMRRGKQGGFRIIYYIRTDSDVFLLTIYAKSERENISADEIRHIIEEEGDLNKE
jgi:mRNA-degrading endonuclease RelE of RelBE toxin-antitoxin system